MKSLFELSLSNLMTLYKHELDNIEIQGVRNGIILSDAGYLINRLRGDIQKIFILHKCKEYDELFDVILNTHNSLVDLQGIIQPEWEL